MMTLLCGNGKGSMVVKQALVDRAKAMMSRYFI